MVLNLSNRPESDKPSDSRTKNDESASDEAPKPAARRRTRRTRSTSSNAKTETAKTQDEEKAEAPTRRRRTTSRTRKDDDSGDSKSSSSRSNGRASSRRSNDDEVDLGALIKALEEQNKQIARLIELEESSRNGQKDSKLARVGVFVDAANVELAADRVKKKIDWKKVLDQLSKDRRLTRAVSYSPTHDDPGVSMETQRFVEPFLDAGFKIVTKPLKRFADGSIKANVDIEMALDIMSMSERLDIVCLVSGDGDFQHLVEVIQSRGVRVEVIGYGTSVAGALRRAADEYIDLETMFGGSSSRRGRRN